MALPLFEHLVEFINLTFTTEVLWIVLPLFIATLIMVFYFEKYLEEEPGWNTHVANSLVLLFVAMSLFRHLYEADVGGAINFINAPYKFLISVFILILGVILLFLNFSHVLPEKYARHLSSPLTVNTFAYFVILWVFSPELGLTKFLSLVIWICVLLLFFNVLRIPLKRMFSHIEKLKEKEEIDDIVREKRKIRKQKSHLKTEEKKVKKKEKQKIKKAGKIIKGIKKKK